MALTKKISTHFQHLSLSKLIGFTYEIHYKSGSENKVVDALFRVTSPELLLMAISVLHSYMEQRLIDSYDLYLNLTYMVKSFQQNNSIHHFSLHNGLSKRKGKLVVGPNDDLKSSILQWLHCSCQGGHSGRDATLKRVKHLFYWRGIAKFVTQYVRNCVTYQAN